MKHLLFCFFFLSAQCAFGQEYVSMTIDTLYKSDSVKLDITMLKLNIQDVFSRSKLRYNNDTLEVQYYYIIFAGIGSPLAKFESHLQIISKEDYYNHCFIEVTGWQDSNTTNPFYNMDTIAYQYYGDYNWGKPTGSACWPLSTQDLLLKSAPYYANPILFLAQNNTIVLYKIYNMHGAIVQQGSTQNQLDCSGLPLGLYIIEIGGKRMKILRR